MRFEASKLLVAGILISVFFTTMVEDAMAQKGPAITDLMESKEATPDAAYFFVILDEDRDGRIDRAEFLYRVMEVFFRRDKNRDTMISRAEATSLSPQYFRQTDLDGDGQLSSYEFNQARFAKFELYDLNRDQIITLDELTVVLRTLR